MKQKFLLPALLSALLLAGCTTESIPALTAPLSPVNEHDLAVVTSQFTADDAEIVPDIPAGIYTVTEQPKEITFSWDKGPNGTVELRWTNNYAPPKADNKLAEDGKVPLYYDETGDGLSSNAIIRCALYDNGEQVSDVYTFVYLCAPEDRFSMPVVSIVSDKRNFYDYDDGILVPGRLADEDNPAGWQAWYHAANYYMRGIEWERPITLSVFDELGNLRLNQNAGVRVSGGYTRNNIQKSLRVYARKDYTPDTGVFPYTFWGNHRGSHTGTPVSYSDTVLFRGGSNNEWSTLFTTPALLMLLEGTYLDAPAIQTVVEYINGAYKGVVTQLEDFDEDYFEVHYGVAKDDLTTMKGSVGEVFEPGGWRIDDGPIREELEFESMLQTLIQADMREPENYAMACKMLDIRNFIEYIAFEAYIANTDWPQNNMRAWRYHGNPSIDGYNPEAEGVFDGRWRFLAKDLDLSFSFQDASKTGNPYDYMKGSCALSMKPLYCSLIKNEEFADLYYTYMCTLMGEVMSYERCERIFDLVQVYNGREVAVSASRLGVVSGSRGTWNSGFDQMRTYASTRSTMIRRFTEKETDREFADITVNIEGTGTVQLGWYDIADGAARSYLCDTRIPLDLYPADNAPEGTVTVTGGHFDDDGYLIVDDAVCTVNVTFPEPADEPEFPANIVINEVKFRNADTEWIELYNPTDETVTLDGWSLGKSSDPLKAQELGTTILEPNSYALICCTDYANSAGIEGLQVTMSLASGDTLTLFDNADIPVDSVVLETPSKFIHLGRFPDGGDMLQLAETEATSAAPNGIAEYEGNFSSDNFRPYMLAWGRVYELEDYFYEKDGVTYVDRKALLTLCSERAANAALTGWLKEQSADMPLDELVKESDTMKGPSVRYVPELDSIIVGN